MPGHLNSADLSPEVEVVSKRSRLSYLNPYVHVNVLCKAREEALAPVWVFLIQGQKEVTADPVHENNRAIRALLDTSKIANDNANTLRCSLGQIYGS